MSMDKTIGNLFLTGLASGLAAFLMPCIFPMLPLTVAYFTKGGRGAGQAALYGCSIVAIYVGMGMLVTICFGAGALNNLATNGLFNFLFFCLLLVFAASLLGAFELRLPHRWVNQAEEKTNKKGISGIFFMAAVLALVSFSCTGPIIGGLLVQAAGSGARLGPAIGMLGFSLALAFPFVLFALFPGWLQSLPKSGSWMEVVKTTLGFLELALSLKFLSNVDLGYHWHWFDREVFLSLWIVITALLGLYLLGKLALGYEPVKGSLPAGRLLLAIVVLSFTIYMVPGLWGAPLKSIAAFLPPQDTQDFDLYTPKAAADMAFPAVRYGNLFKAPLGLPAFFDYREGLSYAHKVNKPVLIDFTGHACVNCRKMEATVWPEPEVLPLIRQDYILVQLYVDDKTSLPGGGSIGSANCSLQAKLFNSNSQPDYVLVDTMGKELAPPQGAVYDAKAYAPICKKGWMLLQKKQPGKMQQMLCSAMLVLTAFALLALDGRNKKNKA
jgi:thiol:disulfide interchange protein